MKKIKVAIIGTGNIGSDLLVKIQRSKILHCNLFIGRDPNSKTIKRAQQIGVNTSTKSIQAIIDNPDCCDIVFDATSASAHQQHLPVFKKLNLFSIDLTPSKTGTMCVPSVNLNECLKTRDVNMISCGGQATIPIAKAIMEIHPETSYIEIVSSIASKSAGIATRDNIDEYTQTTCEAISSLSGAPRSKAIIILNPAEPPIMMRNTIFAAMKNPNLQRLSVSINKTVKTIQKYVPGYQLVLGPIFENNRITIMIKVVGLGDYLPPYAGNLDIINCAAVAVAEAYAQKNSHN